MKNCKIRNASGTTHLQVDTVYNQSVGDNRVVGGNVRECWGGGVGTEVGKCLAEDRMLEVSLEDWGCARQRIQDGKGFS